LELVSTHTLLSVLSPVFTDVMLSLLISQLRKTSSTDHGWTILDNS
jgi:hypothetical protein